MPPSDDSLPTPTPQPPADSSEPLSLDDLLQGPAAARERILSFVSVDPHAYLGPHSATWDGEDGVVLRAFQPDARTASAELAGEATVEMTAIGDAGLFAAWLPGAEADLDYRLTFTFAHESWQRDDPYRFAPTLGDIDLYLFSEGTHMRLWQVMGARPVEHAGVLGVAFSVWAPNARRVSLVGDFCRWDGRLLPMRRLGSSGIFELFVPGLASGELYKFEIVAHDGSLCLKADPLALWAEVAPGTASRTFRSTYLWKDDEWMRGRLSRDPLRAPMVTYEVHLGSWKRGADGEVPGYRELAKDLVEHVAKLGFNYIELLPVAEHPFAGSWGYQISGYYAPTSRFGDPDDFRFFVDLCHQKGIGVLIDWVPGHFVKDSHGLGRFDGTALYEHEDPRLGLHPDWDTYIFNFGRYEVRNFLVANALYWLEEFHIDGLRVDAVASMLYLDYSRRDGEWIANRFGGNENLEAIDFLRSVNDKVRELCPGCFTVAEESTAWPKVSQPTAEGGLGFHLKWNMGWMHDTLSYFAVDPLFRSHCQDKLTFAMMYEYSEHFVNPLSHDEVVHGKGSLYAKMPGDPWRKLAQLRTLFAYQYTRPGKVLLFMGSELAPIREWSHDAQLDWYLLEDPARAGLRDYVAALGQLYHSQPCLWQSDPDLDGFQWVACWDRERSVVSYVRRVVEAANGGPRRSDGERKQDDPGEHLIIVLNLTPMPREAYRLGVPRAGSYQRLLSSDETAFGGSGYPTPKEFLSEEQPADGYRQSMLLALPPLAALILAPGVPVLEEAEKQRKPTRNTVEVLEKPGMPAGMTAEDKPEPSLKASQPEVPFGSRNRLRQRGSC